MNKKAILLLGSTLAVGMASVAYLPSAAAGNMFNMFNPSKWFGSDRHYDDYYYDRWGGPYGYRGWGPGWGGPGWGYGPAYGWGGYPYGYGYPPYGYAAPQQNQKAQEHIPQ
ncbi:MAG TPA: sulfur globule protein CV3 [Sedimenticola thiotaurini]|uniref:Sulfur globule protein CV3 n=1 Tax=Sedimenticola thiotaurini TaxID=1543721 RepID=A0A831W3Q9_9GAMM|nr:sulfur globule protein CV3 [Sedimenticola thiotaurini]